MRSWSEFHCISAKAMSNRNVPPYSFSLISNLFEPNLTSKLLEHFFFSSSAPAWIIPDFPQIFKHISSLYRRRKTGNFKSSSHSSPLRGRTSLLWCGWPPPNWRKLLLLNTEISPRGHELCWQLATDNWHLSEGLQPTVGTDTSRGIFSV